jgi:hypothetical protein
MTKASKAEAPSETAAPLPASLPEILGRLFAGEAVDAEVATRMTFDVGPEAIWHEIMFYEEVPGRPPFPLSVFMPAPVLTRGTKSHAGAIVECMYTSGDLVKRITQVDPGRAIRFEVLDQHLGIETCAVALGGSYEMHPHGRGTTVVLTTKYRAFLHPRPLWRPLEKLISTQLHRHVLKGMRAALRQRVAQIAPAVSA